MYGFGGNKEASGINPGGPAVVVTAATGDYHDEIQEQSATMNVADHLAIMQLIDCVFTVCSFLNCLMMYQYVHVTLALA